MPTIWVSADKALENATDGEPIKLEVWQPPKLVQDQRNLVVSSAANDILVEIILDAKHRKALIEALS